MGKVFVCYRRLDTADLTGRIFDRLAGVFSSEAVFMDVDTLLSGANYRDQITEIIEECDVLLAIIGKEWLTIQNDQGQRRLDNPDDEVRIEIEAALSRGVTVIPLLAHDAELPAEDQLPGELKALALTKPLPIRSGSGFNTDISTLTDELAEQDVHAPESDFPWHYVLLLLGLAMLIIVLWFGFNEGPNIDNYVKQQFAPETPLSELDPSQREEQADRLFTASSYRQEWASVMLWAFLPMGLCPVLLVFGKRLCCIQKDRVASHDHHAWGAGRLPTPKSGKAVVCLALGMASFGWGPLSAIPALIIGALAYRDIQRQPTWMRGRSLVVVGSLCALVGGFITSGIFESYRQENLWLDAMEEAHQLVQARKFSEAEQAAGQAIDLSDIQPLANSLSHLLRGKIRIELANLEGALTDLSSTIEPLEAILEELGYLKPVERGAHDQAQELQREVEKQLGEAAVRAPGGSQPPADRETDSREDAAPIPPAPGADPTAQQWKHRSIMGSKFVA